MNEFQIQSNPCCKGFLLHSRKQPPSLRSCILKVLIERLYFIFFFSPTRWSVSNTPGYFEVSIGVAARFIIHFQHRSILVKLFSKWCLQRPYKTPSAGSILQSLLKHQERGAADGEMQGEALQMVTSSCFNRKTSVVKELINYSLKSR